MERVAKRVVDVEDNVEDKVVDEWLTLSGDVYLWDIGDPICGPDCPPIM